MHSAVSKILTDSCTVLLAFVILFVFYQLFCMTVKHSPCEGKA
jgi:hypothetical protein